MQNSKQNIIGKTSLNTKTDKIEKLSKTHADFNASCGYPIQRT